jgi:hypothetical protein
MDKVSLGILNIVEGRGACFWPQYSFAINSQATKKASAINKTENMNANNIQANSI